jgi:antitoxin HigA-1
MMRKNVATSCTGNGPELWLRLQRDYDLWHATQALGEQIKAIPTLKAAV